jgi:hypothetical protein
MTQISIFKVSMVVAVSLLAGCSSSRKHEPFADVTDKHREHPTTTFADVSADPRGKPATVAAKPAPQATIAAKPVPSQPSQTQAAALPKPNTAPSAVAQQSTKPVVRPATVKAAVVRDIPASRFIVDANGNIRRLWPGDDSLRASGDVVAGPVYWPTIDNIPGRQDWISLFLDPFDFVTSVVSMPFRLIDDLPGSDQTYSAVGRPGGGQAEPSGLPWVEQKGNPAPASRKAKK